MPHKKIPGPIPKFLLCFWAAGLALGQAHSAGLWTLQGHVPKAVQGSAPVGSLPDDQTLHLILGLPLRNEAGLQSLLRDLYDPASYRYHRFLTPEEFTDQFGPTPADYRAVQDFAKRSGLTVEGLYPNRSMVDVAGTVADIRRVFHVRMNQYPHPEGGLYFSPDQEPSVASLIPLQHITGLSDFARRKSKLRKGPANGPGPSKATAKAGTGPSGRFMGYDFRDAYVPDVPATLTGAGQTIALVEFDGYYLSDITYYESHCNPVLSAPAPVSVLIDGFNGVVCNSSSCLDDDDEVSLDIEMAMAMAPGAQVKVYEASPNADYNTAANHIFAAMAAAPLPQQISSSWGGYGDSTTSNLLDQMAAQGQAYFEASGDSGSIGVPGAPQQWTGVSDDQSLYLSQYETLVGGTQLTTSAPSGSPVSISYQSESTWSDSLGASGGGICTLTPIPTYQTQVSMATNGGSGSWRDLPDVSMVASNIEVVAENGGYKGEIEGTSAAAPLWAGFMALVNQRAAGTGKAPLGNPNPALYRIALSPTPYFGEINDIADNSDSRWNTSGGPASGPYTAVAGYDLATGLGSPKGQALVDDLASYAHTYTPTPTPTYTPLPCGYPGATCTFTSTPTPTPTYRLAPTGQLSLGPNVVKGEDPVCLFLPKPVSTSQWDIYDVAGETVAHLTFGKESACWPHSGMASGFYLVRVQAVYADGTTDDKTFKVVLLR